MKTEANVRSQFTLGEILFATTLTFIGIVVLNSVTFTDNPLLGCVVALIATMVGGFLVMKVSTPNTVERFCVMPVSIGIATVVAAWFVVKGDAALQIIAAILLIFGLPIAVGFGIGLLMFPKVLFSYEERRRRFGLILMTTVLFGTAGIIFTTSTLIRPYHCGCGNQTAAAATCKAYTEAQEIYHRTDYDGDGVKEYAQFMSGANSLLETKAGTEDLLIIDPAFAMADFDNPARQSKAGYFFKVLRGGGCAVGSYVDDAGNQTLGYALLAVPSSYDNTGRDSFLIDQRGTLYQKDLGPNTLKIAAGMTDFQIDDTWVLTE